MIAYGKGSMMSHKNNIFMLWIRYSIYNIVINQLSVHQLVKKSVYTQYIYNMQYATIFSIENCDNKNI